MAASSPRFPDGAGAGAATASDAERLLEPLRGLLAACVPRLVEPDRVRAALTRFVAAAADRESAVAALVGDPRAVETLLALFDASPHLAEIAIADPLAWELVRAGHGRPVRREDLAAEVDAEVAAAGDVPGIMRALRRFKRRQTLRIAYGDIVGGQSLQTVVQQISHVADGVVSAALRAAERMVGARRGVPVGPDGRPATIAVIALGKLGGTELNYSSDIDLVFVHSDDGRVAGPKPGTNQEFFERVVQETVRLLAEPTELGAAYRVDLRLRPHGTVGPASLALSAMLRYFDREGRTWERQAWLKARHVAGDAALGARLLADLEPWVHRRWLAATDIAGIKALKRRIERRSERAGTDGSDVKLGRGGIRDIEFTIQFLQLLSGGDAPRVRTPNTLEAIRRLAEAGSLTDQERGILERNYTLLRTVEHRLQILHDRQTHLVPADAAAFGRLALRMGYGPGAEAGPRLRRDLAEATFLNRRILDHLLHDAFPGEQAPEPEVDLVLDPAPADDLVRDVLGRHGFHDVAAAHRQLAALGAENVRFLSARRCRHFLAAIAPRLLAALGRTPDPDATLATLAAVADSLGGKGVLWELFSAHEPSLDLTVNLCASSPFLARLLVGNPGMLDELLDSLLLDHLPAPAELDASLDELLRGAVDAGPILHAFKVSQQLRVGVRDVLGRLAADETTAALTAIAEAVVRAVVARERAALAARLGRPTAEPVVLAMGKFGGREMNYASDVDVVFLYDHDGDEAASDGTGGAATTPAHFFGELARRVAKACNEHGPHGRLYELDSRLRPLGRAGSPAVSLAEFARHFAADGPAAVWERQALVKARVVVGGAAAAARLSRIIESAAWHRTWSAADVDAIRLMRHRMEEGARPMNLKRGPGGVVDIEFIVQMLQLVHGGREPRLRTPETLAGLERLHEAGHLSDGRHAALARAYRTLRSIEGRLRLLDAAARHDFPAAGDDRRRLARLLGYESAERLTDDVEAVTARTREAFERIFAETASGLA
ncbi:MAG: bifunctional [glutamate--ammonia ligase]-adenylyl-L-tyrosine phosphorylase/[glutamate--ammonia-ligase] adenylyltransferase [Planctomycetaceae bacterium]